MTTTDIDARIEQMLKEIPQIELQIAALQEQAAMRKGAVEFWKEIRAAVNLSEKA